MQENVDEITHLIDEHIESMTQCAVDCTSDVFETKAQSLYKLGIFDSLQNHLTINQNLKTNEQYTKYENYLNAIKQQIQFCKYDFQAIFQQRVENLFLEGISSYISNKTQVVKSETVQIKAVEDIQIGTIIQVENSFLLGTTEQIYQQYKIYYQVQQTVQSKQLQLQLEYINQLQLNTNNNLVNIEEFKENIEKFTFNISNQLVDDTVILDKTAAFMPNILNYSHNCNNNVELIFINNICFVVAVQNIKQGQVVSLAHSQPAIPLIQSHFETLQFYNILCKCQTCQKLKKLTEQQIYQLDEESLTVDSCYKIICQGNSGVEEQRCLVLLAKKKLLLLEQYIKKQSIDLPQMMFNKFSQLLNLYQKIMFQDDDEEVQYGIIVKMLYYSCVDGDKCLNQGQLVVKRNCSYKDIPQLLNAAKCLNLMDKCSQYKFQSRYLITTTQQLHDQLLGQIVKFEDFYEDELSQLNEK